MLYEVKSLKLMGNSGKTRPLPSIRSQALHPLSYGGASRLESHPKGHVAFRIRCSFLHGFRDDASIAIAAKVRYACCITVVCMAPNWLIPKCKPLDDYPRDKSLLLV